MAVPTRIMTISADLQSGTHPAKIVTILARGIKPDQGTHYTPARSIPLFGAAQARPLKQQTTPARARHNQGSGSGSKSDSGSPPSALSPLQAYAHSRDIRFPGTPWAPAARGRPLLIHSPGGGGGTPATPGLTSGGGGRGE